MRRARSNTPLQALTTLNEPLFLESAQALALRTLREGGATDTERLDLCLPPLSGAQADAGEKSLNCWSLLEEADSRASPMAGSTPGILPGSIRHNRPMLPKSATPAQLAAWTAVSRVLLNLDETITKE